MSSILDRARVYREKMASESASGAVNEPEQIKQGETAPAPATAELAVKEQVPASVDAGAVTNEAASAPKVSTPSWINAGSYEAAAKLDPNISRGQYAYEIGKYRREQGQPDLSYTEWANILKGQDPYETEADRQKREKNMRTANRINAIGSFINALVNYNRVKSGHVGYTPDKGTDTYNRLERIRLGQEQLAQSRAKDYLGAMAQDRAERAKTEAAAAAAQKAERDYQFKVKELEWKMGNAHTEAERKKAADALAAAKFAYEQEKDARAHEETVRSNKANEAIKRARVEKTGGGKGSKEYLDLHTGNGNKRYSPDEYGSNWVHKAYQDMLKEPGGKDFAVKKVGGLYGGSETPSKQEMLEAITKYNDSQWMKQYKRPGSGAAGNEKPPLE